MQFMIFIMFTNTSKYSLKPYSDWISLSEGNLLSLHVCFLSDELMFAFKRK